MHNDRSDDSHEGVAIIGGGLTGLTAALNLQRAGERVTVYEGSPRVGGAIGSVRHDGWLHEIGPNSLLEGSPEVAAFIDDLGLGPRRVYASPEARKRYVVRAGKLVPMPTSPASFLRTGLFSWPAKVGLLGEPFRRRGPVDRDESVADFVIRRLGREFLDYAVNPFVGGVYAGEPSRLSVRHAFPKLHALEREHGSLIRGALKRRNASGGPKGRIFSFPEGLQEIPVAIAALLGEAVMLSTRVKAVRRGFDGWEVDSVCAGLEETRRHRAVVCAVPADALSHVRFENVPNSEGLLHLREIEHPPVASVFLGFHRQDIAHSLDGFGVLVPKVEKGNILGSLFSSTLFPGRAPAGHVALTTFVGGMRQPQLARADDWDLMRLVLKELTALVGLKTEHPAYMRISRWPRAIPQYELGYEKFQTAITEVEKASPGLHIGGNCRDGISLAQCIASGNRLARAAMEDRVGV